MEWSVFILNLRCSLISLIKYLDHHHVSILYFIIAGSFLKDVVFISLSNLQFCPNAWCLLIVLQIRIQGVFSWKTPYWLQWLPVYYKVNWDVTLSVPVLLSVLLSVLLWVLLPVWVSVPLLTETTGWPRSAASLVVTVRPDGPVKGRR